MATEWDKCSSAPYSPARDLRMSVDFGTVCMRCGARLLDERVVNLALGRRDCDPRGGWQEIGQRWLVLCVPCADAVWPGLLEAWAAARRTPAQEPGA